MWEETPAIKELKPRSFWFTLESQQNRPQEDCQKEDCQSVTKDKHHPQVTGGIKLGSNATDFGL